MVINYRKNRDTKLSSTEKFIVVDIRDRKSNIVMEHKLDINNNIVFEKTRKKE